MTVRPTSLAVQELRPAIAATLAALDAADERLHRDADREIAAALDKLLAALAVATPTTVEDVLLLLAAARGDLCSAGGDGLGDETDQVRLQGIVKRSLSCVEHALLFLAQRAEPVGMAPETRRLLQFHASDLLQTAKEADRRTSSADAT